MRKKPLSDQIIVVTRASSGLGRAIARAAGERGAKVVVTARNAEALENCVAEIERAGSEALAVPADCAEREVRYPAWRPRSPRQVRRSVTWLHGLDTASPAAPEGLTAVASMTLEWHCSN